MNELIEALMTLTFHDTADVAETIVSVIERRNPPLRVAGTWDAALFDLLRRLLPGRLYQALLYASLPDVWEWGELEAGAPPPEERPSVRFDESSLPPAPGDRATLTILRAPLRPVSSAVVPRATTLPSAPPSASPSEVPSTPRDTVLDEVDPGDRMG